MPLIRFYGVSFCIRNGIVLDKNSSLLFRIFSLNKSTLKPNECLWFSIFLWIGQFNWKLMIGSKTIKPMERKKQFTRTNIHPIENKATNWIYVSVRFIAWFADCWMWTHEMYNIVLYQCYVSMSMSFQLEIDWLNW